MDEAHLEASLRYLALNPVRARLAKRAVITDTLTNGESGFV